MKIETVLSQIDLGTMALPEFQRGYVWNRDQVRGLMQSLYRQHPVGSLLVWVTHADATPARGGRTAHPGGIVELLLDGQQRVTSLYGIIRGRPPRFFDGDARAFTDLYFNLEEEVFEFYAPVKMKDNPLWINVTEVMRQGVGESIGKLYSDPIIQGNLNRYISRVTAIDNIKNIEIHIEKVTGEDKNVDVVVDIFNRVNSGGTKLSKGDLALAKLCASWPEARDEMKERLHKWNRAGYQFRLEWLLRCITTQLTGEAMFTALADVKTPEFQEGLAITENRIDSLLNLISSRLGLDHDRVLGSRYSFPLLVRYLDQMGGAFSNHQEQDKLLYWYVHTFLWGRYAGSTESILNQDLALIDEQEGAIDRLIDRLRQQRGDLRVNANDFHGWSKGSRFYPLLYMLTRVQHSRDWGSGIELNNYLLGKGTGLNLHHIFPKALLYKSGYSKAEANALANFTFLTQETNFAISDKPPLEYLPQFRAKHPGSVKSHWVPIDPELWKVENYREFLAQRRVLLADAANEFLDGLVGGVVELGNVAEAALERKEPIAPGPVGGIVSDEEEAELQRCNAWVIEQGLPEGLFSFEVADPETGEAIVVLDLAWPEGLQPGLSSPVTLLLDEDIDTEEAANRSGFRYYTSVAEFISYVRREVLVLELAAV
ncbi:DUF262 domain-containing protein [soil metagenome]